MHNNGIEKRSLMSIIYSRQYSNIFVFGFILRLKICIKATSYFQKLLSYCFQVVLTSLIMKFFIVLFALIAAALAAPQFGGFGASGSAANAGASSQTFNQGGGFGGNPYGGGFGGSGFSGSASNGVF